jgi:hypothetical protein
LFSMISSFSGVKSEHLNLLDLIFFTSPTLESVFQSGIEVNQAGTSTFSLKPTA